MLPTSARLLRLLSLLQARRFWSGAELAERLAVTDRTLRRDVDRLRGLGYPVASTSGVAGGYQLGAGVVMPPLSLDDDEALAATVALGTAASSSVSGIDEAALRALGKLERVLPARLRDRVDALRATIIPLERADTRADLAVLSELATACHERRLIRFGYTDATGRASERRVEPQGLVHTGYRWYLVAWDVEREDFRTFRVDRIQGTPALGARVAPRPPPEGGDLRAFVSRTLSNTVYEVRASVILHAPFETIAPRASPSSALLEPIDPARCRLRAGARSTAILAAWLLMLDVDFEIEEPAELRERVRELHARLGRALGHERRGHRPAPPRARSPRAPAQRRRR